jgi:mRNA interferase MazF
MRRGEIWVARLNPNVGSEVGKVRPVLIVLNDALLETGMSPVLCLPLTSKLFQQMAGLRVEIPPRGRLLKTCYVMPEQMRALDRSRFGDSPLARLSNEEMVAVERLFAAVAGMSYPLIPPH